jgi:hypothetical protein
MPWWKIQMTTTPSLCGFFAFQVIALETLIVTVCETTTF